MTRWSELPLWAWALGLRNGVNFRANPDSGSPGVGRAPQPTPCVGENAINEAQVITSVVEYPQPTGWHKPVLDIDFPAQLIPSSTEGHFHLYLDKELPWDKYQRLLTALAEAGVIEVGYANASIARGYTSVRLPWVSKDDDPAEEPEAPTEAPVPAEPVVRYDARRQQYEIGPSDGDNLVLTNEWLRGNPRWPIGITERVAELGVTDWPAERDAAARLAGASWMQRPVSQPFGTYEESPAEALTSVDWSAPPRWTPGSDAERGAANIASLPPAGLSERERGLWPHMTSAARAQVLADMAAPVTISPRRNLRQELIEGEVRRQAEANAATAARRTRERLIADSTFDRAAAGVAASIAANSVWNGNHTSLVADMHRLGEQVRAGMDQATQSMQGFRSDLAIVDEIAASADVPTEDVTEALRAASASEWTLRA